MSKDQKKIESEFDDAIVRLMPQLEEFFTVVEKLGKSEALRIICVQHGVIDSGSVIQVGIIGTPRRVVLITELLLVMCGWLPEELN